MHLPDHCCPFISCCPNSRWVCAFRGVCPGAHHFSAHKRHHWRICAAGWHCRQPGRPRKQPDCAKWPQPAGGCAAGPPSRRCVAFSDRGGMLVLGINMMRHLDDALRLSILHLLPPASNAAAGLAVHQVQGLQLHGTGTSLGDPIEVGAAAGAQRFGMPPTLTWIHLALLLTPHSATLWGCIVARPTPSLSALRRPGAGGAGGAAPLAGQQVGAGPQRAGLRHHGPRPPAPGESLS